MLPIMLPMRMCLIATIVSAQQPVEESIQVDGRLRTYHLYLPASASVYLPASASGKLPLVIGLHGSGGDAGGMARVSGFQKLGMAEGFLVVFPNGYGKNWNDGRDIPSWPAHQEKVNDVAFLSALIDHLIATRNADRKRVFVTGISNGGLMSHRAGCELAAKVAAIAPVVRTLTTKMASSCTPSRPIPVLMFFGTADKLVPFGGGKQIMAGNFAVDTLSADATIRHWATKNGCAAEPGREVSSSGGHPVTHVRGQGCRADAEAYILDGAGHAWPGGDLAATGIIWRFFQAHPLP